MGRLYTVSFSKVATTVAADLFEITPADDKSIEIIGLFIANNSDFGDAQAENIPYKVIRGNTTSGSGGTAPTPRPLDRNGPAAGFTAEVNNTTAASAGSPLDLHASAFNVAVGEALWLPEGCGWQASQADTLIVVRLASAPADSIELSGTLYVKEF
jgi:hypothetical protein